MADEGGWWPAFRANEQALEPLVRAIEQAGFAPGRQVAVALDIAASEFGRGRRYRLGLEKREFDTASMTELLGGTRATAAGMKGEQRLAWRPFTAPVFRPRPQPPTRRRGRGKA